MGSMERIRLLLADDHALFRDGVASIMAAQEDIEVVGEASDGLEALERTSELMPDLILMDINMPRCDGLEATRLIKNQMPYVKIVMLTVHDEDEKVFEAVKSGAQGYLLKNIRSKELLGLVRGVAKGEAPISPSVAGKILKEFASLAQQAERVPEAVPTLTLREREVLQQVATGAANKQIATALCIAENTVKNHLRNILEKLHLKNRSQAAAYALRQGIILPLSSPQAGLSEHEGDG